jgi:hypothetical protein
MKNRMAGLNAAACAVRIPGDCLHGGPETYRLISLARKIEIKPVAAREIALTEVHLFYKPFVVPGRQSEVCFDPAKELQSRWKQRTQTVAPKKIEVGALQGLTPVIQCVMQVTPAVLNQKIA